MFNYLSGTIHRNRKRDKEKDETKKKKKKTKNEKLNYFSRNYKEIIHMHYAGR